MGKIAMRQLSLFDNLIEQRCLKAESSPRQAFYNLSLVLENGSYCVKKESGVKGKVLDKRSWSFPSFAAAEKFYKRKLREKMNPGRKSPRKYAI